MAWQSLGTTSLINGGYVMGYCHFEYEDSSSEPRQVRLRISPNGGNTFYVNFDNVTVDGTNVGSWQNLTQASGTFWTGYVSGGRNVTASWTNPWYGGVQYPSITVYLPAGGTPPTGLAATLVEAGPDWADIAVSISSWGSPSGSANRYIEASVLGSSTYGNPYKFKMATAVMSATLHVDNTGSGNLTIVPNTQYRVGGYATNKTRSASTVGATFATLPAVPVVSAVDQGHGVINFTVTHANEGSAYTVTDEYSADGGTTWTAISGGAFTLTLATQTEVTIRRSSTAGDSVATITVVPQFDVGIYASANGKTVKVTKVYAPSQGSSPVAKKVAKIYASVNGKTKLVYEDPS